MNVLKIKFGMSGEKVDAFGIRFYGYFDSKIEHLGSISKIFSDPDVSPIIQYKRITLWFTLENIRSYNEVSDLLNGLMVILKKEGYAIVISSLDKLFDATSLEYANKPESRFPTSNRMHGYNATSGFSVTAEKTDAESKFSRKEIKTIQELAIKFGRTVYGRSLKRLI